MDTPPQPLPASDEAPWVLSEADSQRFIDAILDPPEPTPTLRAAIARYNATRIKVGG